MNTRSKCRRRKRAPQRSKAQRMRACFEYLQTHTVGMMGRLPNGSTVYGVAGRFEVEPGDVRRLLAWMRSKGRQA